MISLIAPILQSARFISFGWLLPVLGLGLGQDRLFQAAVVRADHHLDMIRSRPDKGDKGARLIKPEPRIAQCGGIIGGSAPPVEIANGTVERRNGQRKVLRSSSRIRA